MPLRLLGQCDQARLESARCADHANEAAQHEDEHDDVNSLNGALHHADRDIPQTSRVLRDMLISARDGNCLRQCTRGELIDVDLHAQAIESLLRSVQNVDRTIRIGHVQLARVRVIHQLRIRACRNQPGGDCGNNRQGKQNRKSRRN